MDEGQTIGYTVMLELDDEVSAVMTYWISDVYPDEAAHAAALITEEQLTAQLKASTGIEPTPRPGAQAFNDQRLANLLNRFVPKASPLGAWTIGVVTVLAMRERLVPDVKLLRDASRVPGFSIDPDSSHVQTLFEAFKRRMRRKTKLHK